MKNEKGIALISLIIYVIVLSFVIAIIANITASFYSNANEFDLSTENAVSISKFNMYFVNDIKRKGVIINGISDNYIILSYSDENEVVTNAEYSMQNNALYRNKVKICDNVDMVRFTILEENVIKVNFRIGGYEKTTTYVIENGYNTNNSLIII